MSVRCFERAVRLAVAPDVARAWHDRAAAASARLAPPWERPGALEQALARHRHTRALEPDGGAGTRLVDRVELDPRDGLIGALGAGAFERRLDRAFAWRHAVTRADLAMHARQPGPMRVLVTGGSGFIGSALVPALEGGGHAVVTLTRRGEGPRERRWDPDRGVLDPRALEGFDAVVHLASENVHGPWDAAHRRRIRDSRVNGTTLLARTLAALAAPPAVLVSSSASGFYGSRGDEPLDEGAGRGEGFMADVAAEWEAATGPAAAAGIRVVRVRTPLVLDPRGGALGEMLLPFRLGIAGPLAGGRAWWSWITRDDLVDVMHRALVDGRLDGAVNASTPDPVRNAEYTRVLGRVLARPAFLPVPALALRVLYGGFADEGLLTSTRLVPARLLAVGHPFRHPRIEPALRALLGRASHAEATGGA